MKGITAEILTCRIKNTTRELMARSSWDDARINDILFKRRIRQLGHALYSCNTGDTLVKGITAEILTCRIKNTTRELMARSSWDDARINDILFKRRIRQLGSVAFGVKLQILDEIGENNAYES